jgi:hypothetical protein
MPSDAIDVQAGALTDLSTERRVSVNEKAAHHVDRTKNAVAYSDTDVLDDGYPTEEELDGPNHLRRVSAPIPWAVYTVAFVELCERFSYYGTQVVCKFSPHQKHVISASTAGKLKFMKPRPTV